MKKMTGEKFISLIEKDPSWCLCIKEPIEITTFVNLSYGNITHLSPLLTFSGKNEDNWVANFYECENLKVATGTFHGFVHFGYSGIEKIENLNVTETDKVNESTSFSNCQNLKVATGNYKGRVNFSNSGVTTIKNLNIKAPDNYGEKAHFLNCPILYIPKEYRGKEYIFNKKIIEKSILKDKITKEAINIIKSEANNIEI